LANGTQVGGTPRRLVRRPDLASQKKIGEQIQAEAFENPPYLPLGEYLQPTAHAKTITGLLKGMPLFWNVKKEG